MATTFGRIFKDKPEKFEQKPIEAVETLATAEKESVETTEQKPTRKKASAKD